MADRSNATPGSLEINQAGHFKKEIWVLLPQQSNEKTKWPWDIRQALCQKKKNIISSGWLVEKKCGEIRRLIKKVRLIIAKNNL